MFFKRFIALFLVILPIFTFSLREEDVHAKGYENFAKFIAAMRCPDGLKYDKTKHVLKHGEQGDRVVNAERLRQIAEDNGVDVKVPRKCFYTGRKTGKLYVLADRVKHDPKANYNITNDEADGLITLAEKSKFSDWGRGNVVRDVDGNIVILDTESRSFFPDKILPVKVAKEVTHFRTLGALSGFLLSHNNSSSYFKIQKNLTEYEKQLPKAISSDVSRLYKSSILSDINRTTFDQQYNFYKGINLCAVESEIAQVQYDLRDKIREQIAQEEYQQDETCFMGMFY